MTGPTMLRAGLLGLGAAVSLAPAVRADMVVTGSAAYVDREFTYATGWTGEEPELPVRLARVLVIDDADGSVLAEGATDATGAFAIPVVGSGTVDLRVRILSETYQLAPETLRVRPLNSDLTYSVSSPVFVGWSLQDDLDAGLTVADKVFSGNQQGNPFNALDMAVDAFGFLADMGLPPSTPPHTILWPGGGGSQGNLDTTWLANDDGYDDIVALHELGHAVDARYSEPDTTAGTHFFGESDQQPSLSLSEGFASWFAGAVRQHVGTPNPGFYMDAVGTGATGSLSIQLRADFETRAPYVNKTGGEADEVAVFAALWDVTDTAATDDGEAGDDDLTDGSFLFGGRWTGARLVLEAMRSDTVLNASAVHVIDLWDGLFVDLGVTRFDELATCFENQKIAVLPDALEPDDWEGAASWLVADAGWSDTRTLVSSRTWPPAPGSGDEDHLLFDLPAATKFEISTRYPGNKADAETYANTAIMLFAPDGTSLGFSTFGGKGDNALMLAATGEAGTYRAVISSFDSIRRTGRYEVRVKTLGPVQPPVLTWLSPASLPSVPEGYLQSILLQGEELLGVTSVTIGGVESDFNYQGGTIWASLPLLPSLGPQPVVVTSAAGSSEMEVTVTAPDPPAINISSGSLYWGQDPTPVKLGAEPYDTMFLFLSFTEEPTVLGPLDLAIGAGGKDLHLIDVVTMGSGGTLELSFRRPESPGGFVPVWVQGAVERATGVTFPLVSTGVEPGILQP